MDIKLGEHNYRTGRLTPRQQLHIARRLAPVLGGLAKEALGLTEAKMDAMSEAQLIGSIAGPVAEGLAKMKQDDVDYVLDTCLSVVHRLEAEGKSMPVMNPGTRQMQYEDIDLPGMMRLCVSVVQENLGSFFPGQPRA